MYKDTQKRWVGALLLGNYLQFMLAMARKFLLVLLFAWLAAAAISTGILGVVKWVDTVRVKHEALAAATIHFSTHMVAQEISGWEFQRPHIIDGVDFSHRRHAVAIKSRLKSAQHS